MIRPDQIPTESVKAAWQALMAPDALAMHRAIAAAINAWPGAYQTTGYNTYFENLFDHVVIPLPQEKQND